MNTCRCTQLVKARGECITVALETNVSDYVIVDVLVCAVCGVNRSIQYHMVLV